MQQELHVSVVTIPDQHVIGHSAQDRSGCLGNTRFDAVQVADAEAGSQGGDYVFSRGLKLQALLVRPGRCRFNAAQRLALSLDLVDELTCNVVLMQVVVNHATMKPTLSRPDGSRHQA